MIGRQSVDYRSRLALGFLQEARQALVIAEDAVSLADRVCRGLSR